jgi:hypothetical protein
MRNPINVIASEAKQSIFLSLHGEMDCFAALAMTVPMTRHTSAVIARHRIGAAPSLRSQ